MNITVRRATPDDIPGICHVNRGEAGPWAEMESCTGHIMTRLNYGFYIQVAEIDGQIVGHGEWIISDEYRWKTCYLGQLQVDPDWQHCGIGRKMLSNGASYARASGCSTISLIPEQDTNSQIFYAKCGLTRGSDILSCVLPSQPGSIPGEMIAKAPHSVVKEMPFVFGLTQTASEHMWQVFNNPAPWDTRRKDTLIGDGFCLQLGGFSIERNAMLLCWAKPGSEASAVSAAKALAHDIGYPGVEFHFMPGHAHLFEGTPLASENYEMYLRL